MDHAAAAGADVSEWIEMPSGAPYSTPSDRAPVLLASPVPRQGRGEPPRIIQVRSPMPLRRRRRRF